MILFYIVYNNLFYIFQSFIYLHFITFEPLNCFINV